MNSKYIFLILFLIFISLGVGAYIGANIVANKCLSVAEQILDIRLNDKGLAFFDLYKSKIDMYVK